MRRIALRLRRRSALAALVALGIATPSAAQIPYPILFVTQTPNGGDFANLLSTFGTHRGDTESAPRGGDLWVLHPDGTRRNLTAEAGYGSAGHEIAVRDPSPHPDGTRALFSMVIGGTTQDDYDPVYFQIYEVTGFGQGQTVSIRRLAQPSDYNNVSPVYGAGDRILFTSDRPRNGDRRLYPQLDEYETAPTVSGLWSMRADGSDLVLLDHAPSGVFEPLVDSFGRVVFSRWDHLQRDQQADSDIADLIAGQPQGYGAFTFENESSDAYHALAPGDETFPEQRELYGGDTPNPVWDHMLPTETEHTFNHFFPWAVEQDGTGLEILDHLGRHELAGYIAPGRTYLDYAGVEQRVDVFLHIAEDPTQPGTYYGIQCPEFGTRSAGQIVSITAPPGANADTIPVAYVTHPATGSVLHDGEPPDADHIGMFRDPVVLSDGSLWASHTSNVYYEDETVSNPPYPQPYTLSSRNDFAIRKLVPGANSRLTVGARLMAEPIVKSVSYFDNDRYRTTQYTGPLWELQPIEVRPRVEPVAGTETLPAIESDVLADELGGNGLAALRIWLRQNQLALITSRDVTVRADRQQDFDLKVAWSAHQTATPGSTPKEIGWLQLFEGRQLRGFEWDGRRVLARPIASALNPPEPGAPSGAVKLGDDGSMAAFVPARRALSWQTTEADGAPAVRERYWLTFQPGEIRVCTNCHGVNTHDVFGGPIPSNPPAALRELVAWWRDEVLPVPEPASFMGGFGALLALLTLSSSASTRSRG
jgi:hypothetical protein